MDVSNKDNKDYMISDNKYKNYLFRVFKNLVRISSGSINDTNLKKPTSKGQIKVFKDIKKELKKMKVKEIKYFKNGYLYAYIPCETTLEKPFLLMAHVDTYPNTPNKNVKVKTEILPNFDIKFSSLDGKTLLGADDKAGIAEILTIVKYYKTCPWALHRPIEILFTSDEEVGRGVEDLPFHIIKSEKGFTIDGSAYGEVNYECFNAKKIEVTIKGHETHTGYAKNKMINATTILNEYIKSLPKCRPENASGRKGFISINNMKANIGSAYISLNLRAFDKNEMDELENNCLKFIWDIRENSENKYFSIKDNIKVSVSDQYNNCRDMIPEEFIERVRRAFKLANVKIKEIPIRGGTDGSLMTTKYKIPMINIYTGSYEFHSVTEYALLNEMYSVVELLKHIF